MTTVRDPLSRFTAIGEICVLLVVGNLVGRGLFSVLISPELAATAEALDAPDLLPAAGVSAIQLTLRFGAMMLLGFAWLWWRSRKTPRDCGFTRNGWPLSRLIVAGMVLYAVASLPLLGLLLTNEYVPFGTGLQMWERDPADLTRFDFWVLILAGSALLPPLYEELVFRGYMRVRIAENFGPMGGVVITTFLFALAHGQYYAADALLLATLPCVIFAGICWAYVTYRTGSLLPAMVAHALVNMPIPHQPNVLIILLTGCTITILLARGVVREYFGCFIADWRSADRRGMAFGTLVVCAFVVPALTFTALDIGIGAIIWGSIWLIAFIIAMLLNRHRLRNLGLVIPVSPKE